jgi:iron complex outermembrane receptor protein
MTGVIMRKYQNNAIRGLAFSASAMAMIVASPALAQDADATPDEDDEEQVDVTEDGADTSVSEGITVTGSRIVRDTYTSISPLQVITTDDRRNVGAFDSAEILQRSQAASGTQIDATFQGFVLDNGPGSQTLNLRGLGADRTLLLVNNRRFAPAGVEGAPTNPSINLIPSTLVDRFDLLLDGASSVYGSDAVAGVVNVLLRKDFDGLELQAQGNLNEQGAGHDFTVSAAWGFNTDRAFFGIGAEYSRRDEILLEDRDFLAGCDTHREIDQNGNILTTDVEVNANILEDSGGAVAGFTNECRIQGIAGLVQIPTRLGFGRFDSNGGNSGVPNLSAVRNAFGTPVDADGDGIIDVNEFDRNINGVERDVTFISPEDRYNVFAYGEYTFPGEANLTPFFEVGYARVENEVENSGSAQFFPWVPATNQFNPCNFVSNPNGVDCSAADNQFNGLVPPSPFAAFALPTGRLLPARPVPSVRGDRNNVDVALEQYRGTFGLRGDLPFVGSSWTFEAAGTYSRSEGGSVRRGIREDRLALAIGIDPTADFDGDGVVDNDGDGIADDYNSQPTSPLLPGGACDTANLANPGLAAPDLTAGCVPVNLFAASLLGPIPGELSSQAERDYLFGVRSFDTTYEQILLSAFVTGDLFELPAGPVGAVLGVEWREDSINSNPDLVASNGLFWGFFADGGASGSKWIREAYGELEIPLQAGKPWVEELTVQLAGRVTDEEFYGTNGTYSIKAGWRPVSPVLLRFNYGTSFRAPNLRENFLRGQSGFNTLFDPCAVPDAAFNSLAGGYNPALDTRDPAILANCTREGRDPTRVGIDTANGNTQQFASVEISTGGSLDIDPETSRSIVAGAVFDETLGDGFDVRLSVDYFDIKLKDSIVEPASQFIINDCFARQDGSRSPFCDRINFDTNAGSRLLISNLNSGFINLNEESVRGLDFRATLGKEVTIGNEGFDLGLNVQANHLIERSTTFIDENGDRAFDDDAGEFGLPSWTGLATFTIEYDKWLFSWETNFISATEQQADGIDPLSDAFGNGPDGLPTGFVGNTCTGGGSPSGVVAGDGIFCRDIGFTNDYFVHAMALRYRNNNMTVRAGITNLFDRSPPLVDCNELGACISNVPIGNGFDLNGREFFASIQYAF